MYTPCYEVKSLSASAMPVNKYALEFVLFAGA